MLYWLAAQFLVARIEAKVVASSQRLELVRRIPAPAPQLQRDRPVEQAGIHVRKVEMPGERPGDCALPARGRSVDGNHEALAPSGLSSNFVVQARRFDRANSLWQGAPPNAAAAFAATGK